MKAFDVCDHSTWQDLLTIEQFAAIQQTTVRAIRDRVARGRCEPPPVLRLDGLRYVKPYRWRRSLVTAYVEGRLSSFGRSHAHA